MDLFLQITGVGLINGAVYVLVALGMTLLYGVMRIINFAHGDFFMVALYIAYFASLWSGGLVTTLAVPVVLVGAMALTGLLFFILLRKIVGEVELSHVMLTVGLSIVLQNCAQLLFSADFRSVNTSKASILHIGGVHLQARGVWAFGCAIGVTVILYILTRRTHFGRVLRAVSESRENASLIGIRSVRALALSSMIGMACLGLAAYVMAPVIGASPTIGSFYTVIGFVVVVVGGLGDMPGTLTAGFIVGLTEAYGGAYLPASTGELLVYVLLFAVLAFRPSGIFKKGRLA